MKFKIIRLGIFCSLSLLTFNVNGQNIIRSSINCFGNSFRSGGLILRQTAGQSSNTESFINGQQLRQGFQQPIDVNVKSVRKSGIIVNLFPNPATVEAKLTVSENLGEYEIFVSDITGKRITIIRTNTSENIINCNRLPVSTCIVSIVKNGEFIASTKLVIQK